MKNLFIDIFAVALLIASFICTFSEGMDGNVTIWNFIGIAGFICAGGLLFRDEINNTSAL